MDERSKTLLTVGLPVITVLIAILINNRQIDAVRKEMRDLRSDLIAAMDARFAAMDAKIDGKFEGLLQGLLRVEGVLDARLKHLEENR